MLLSAILRSAPDLHGILVDRESVIPAARVQLDKAAVAERAEREYAAPLHNSGFALARVVTTASPAGLGVFEANAV